jgi:hypothetical protein
MSSNRYFSIFFHTLVFAALATTAFSTLSSNYYDYTCPNALSTIRSVVKAAVQKENRMGASLLRLHFHDCFVNVRSSNSLCIYFKKKKILFLSLFRYRNFQFSVAKSYSLKYLVIFKRKISRFCSLNLEIHLTCNSKRVKRNKSLQ